MAAHNKAQNLRRSRLKQPSFEKGSMAMSIAIADEERAAFSRRLHQSLLSAGMAQINSTNLCKEYNLRADGARVSNGAAKKWLAGESIPTQEKLHILARWLGVSAEWLRFGEDGTRHLAEQLGSDVHALPPADRIFLDDLHGLPARDQVLVRAILDMLLRRAQSEAEL